MAAPVTTRRSAPVDGFRLAYELDGDQPRTVALLHGWPGDRSDYRLLRPMLAPHARLVTPDLRGFGESDKHVADPTAHYDASAQARSVVGLLEELDAGPAVLVGYDIGSRVAQAVARTRPDLVHALVLAPPLPGAGTRTQSPRAQAQFWYQHLHRLDLSTRLFDANPAQLRAYLAHFWDAWSGPDFVLPRDELDALLRGYVGPGHFHASTHWYRAGAADDTPPAQRWTTPTTVLWPEFDPLFPREWSDRLDEYYSDLRLHLVDGVGHFAPLEYPHLIDAAVREHLR